MPRVQTSYSNWLCTSAEKQARGIEDQKSSHEKIKIRTLKPYGAAPAVMIGDLQSKGNFPSVPRHASPGTVLASEWPGKA